MSEERVLRDALDALYAGHARRAERLLRRNAVMTVARGADDPETVRDAVMKGRELNGTIIAEGSMSTAAVLFEEVGPVPVVLSTRLPDEFAISLTACRTPRAEAEVTCACGEKLSLAGPSTKCACGKVYSARVLVTEVGA